MKKTNYEKKSISIKDFEEVKDPGTLDTRGCCDCNSQKITCTSEDRAMQYNTKSNSGYFGRLFSSSVTTSKESQ